ncbi:MAG: TonB family protein [Pedosphaera sp.]|nr:TonB family protein [Pedosphaera sp.]
MSLNPTRCLAASISLHGVLLAVLFLAPAFSRKLPEMIEVQTLEFIPAEILDKEFNHLSGGTPTPAPLQPKLNSPGQEPPKPEVKSVPDPAVQKHPIKPTPVVTKAEPLAPAKPAETIPEKIHLAESPVRKQASSKPAPEDPAGDPQPKVTKPVKREIQLSANKVKVSASEANTARKEKQKLDQERIEAEDSHQAEVARDRQVRELSENRRRATQLIMDRLAKGLSSGVNIDLPSGGESYAGYASALGQLYKSAWSRFKPATTSRDIVLVRVEVTIARDGTILSARVVTPSGVVDVDRSVERTLREVTRAPEFPKTNRDAQRIFPITFQLDGNSGA